MSRVASVLTHRRAGDTMAALGALIGAARRADVTLRFDEQETRKHGLTPGEGIEIDAGLARDVDLCVVMGGDGTILTALRAYANTGVPVFAVNFGEVGFLATLDPDGLDADFDRAFSGDFDRWELPGITIGRPEGTWTAMNDISVHRKPGFRVADLAYALAGEEIGRVRCDGLVVATPQGSSAYTLASGGPLIAHTTNALVITPLAPHGGSVPSVVLPGEGKVRIGVDSGWSGARIEIDGRVVAVEEPEGEQSAFELEATLCPGAATLLDFDGETLIEGLRRRGVISDSPRLRVRDNRAASAKGS